MWTKLPHLLPSQLWWFHFGVGSAPLTPPPGRVCLLTLSRCCRKWETADQLKMLWLFVAYLHLNIGVIERQGWFIALKDAKCTQCVSKYAVAVNGSRWIKPLIWRVVSVKFPPSESLVEKAFSVIYPSTALTKDAIAFAFYASPSAWHKHTIE